MPLRTERNFADHFDLICFSKTWGAARELLFLLQYVADKKISFLIFYS